MTEATTKPATNLTVGVNGDGAVNIFDLAIAAGNFGQSAVTAALAIATRMELGHLTAGSYSQTEKAIYGIGRQKPGSRWAQALTSINFGLVTTQRLER